MAEQQLRKPRSSVHSSQVPPIEASTTSNMPILAYSRQEDVPESSILALHEDIVSDMYNVQLANKDSDNSKLPKSHNRNQNGSVQSQPLGTFGAGANQVPTLFHIPEASTPKTQHGSPERIFEAKPPTNIQSQIVGNQQLKPQQPLGLSSKTAPQQQAIQNVFQFNVRVNNGGGVLVSTEGGQPIHSQHSMGGQREGSRKRRPSSSKHANLATKGSHSHANAPNQNPYFGATANPSSIVNIQQRRVLKKRPQSATRKVPQGKSGHTTITNGASYKSPNLGLNSLKKQGLTSLSSQKQRTFNHFSHPSTKMGQAQAQVQAQLLPSGPILSQDSFGVEQGITLSNATPFQPYSRSIKVPSLHPGSSKSNQLQAMKNALGQNLPISIFGSPEKGGRGPKSKIPTMTLQSREDLYEQNMHTKVEINSLRNENRKINTKLLVLENQLAQKDKLFEDMYKAAFAQSRHPLPHSSPHMPNAASANAFQNGPNGGTTSFVPQKSAFGHNNGTSAGMSSQQHAQAQQLISSYKRTIREQSRELDKKDLEIDGIKRSVKMTQINQVLVENEAYRSECIRLRGQVEQLMWMQQQQQQVQVATPMGQALSQGTTQTVELAQLMPNTRGDSATDTFKRDLSQMQQALSEKAGDGMEGQSEAAANQERLIDELRQQNDQLLAAQNSLEASLAQARKEVEASGSDARIKALESDLTEAQASLEASAKAQEAREAEWEKKASILEADKAMLRQKLENERDQVASENNDDLAMIEEQLAIKKMEMKDLEKELDNLVYQNQMGVKDLQKMEATNDTLLKKLQSQESMILKTNQMAQSRAQMLIEVENDKEDLAEEVRDLKAKLEAQASSGTREAELEKQLEFKKNELQAQEYEHDLAIKELSEKLKTAQALLHDYSSPPIAPGTHQSRRRSTKKSRRTSNLGESSFERAPESNEDGQPGTRMEEDRSDLGFTSQEDIEPMPLNDSQEGGREAKSKKIELNDKTIFGPDGLPMSPKEVNATSSSVVEGFQRLRHACQVYFIKHDAIENYLFGNDYKPEGKLTIRQVKESAIERLGMREESALDWARYLIEQASGTIAATASFDNPDFVLVDQDRKLLAVRVIMFILSKIQGDLVYFRAEKEEKMKLIIGEKLQEPKALARILSVLKQDKRAELTCEELRGLFERLDFSFNYETLVCLFIHLLKKGDDLLRVRKADLTSFVHQSAGKAHDFTMTTGGQSRFPLETELVYSTDSDEGAEKPGSRHFTEEDATHNKTVKSATNAELDQVVHPDHQVARQKSQDPHQASNYQSVPAQAPQQKEQQLGDSEGSDDDDFGANDSRSEYSGAPVGGQEAPIEEDVVSEEAPSQSLKVEQNQAVIEDSINDREDLDHSYNTGKGQKHDLYSEELRRVSEVEEQRETTIEKEELSQRHAQIGSDLKPSMQRSKSIGDEHTAFEHQQPKGERQSIRHTQSEVPSQSDINEARNAATNGGNYSTGNSSDTYSVNAGGTRKKGRRPIVKIDVQAVKSGGRPSCSSGNNQARNNLEEMKVTNNGHTVPSIQINDADSINDRGSCQESDAIELVPLKDHMPAPHGITVVQEQHSVYERDQSEPVSPVTPFDQYGLQPLKEELPLPFGITVAQEQHSVCGGVGENGTPTSGQMDEDLLSNSVEQAQVASHPEAREHSTRRIGVREMESDKSEPGFDMHNEPVMSPNSTIQVEEQEPVIKVEKQSVQVSPLMHQKVSAFGDISLPSASKLVDDSFGQTASVSQGSPPKPQMHQLPPLELLQLKVPQSNPIGIAVGELLTDRSARPGDDQSRLDDDKQINDFKPPGGLKDDSKDSEDYSEDDMEDERDNHFGQQPAIVSAMDDTDAMRTPADLKVAMGGPDLPSEIKQPPHLVSSEGQSEVEEDYEF